MEHEFFNFQTVLEAVPGQIDALVNHLFPNARKQAGGYRVGGADGERGSSLSISSKPVNAGCFHDFADESVKGNAIGLWATVKGCSYKDAGNALAQFLGVSSEPRLHMAKKRPEPKITKTENEFTFQIGNRIESVKPLNTKSINYAASRKIGRGTLRLARCASTDNDIIFPHFDEDDKLVMLKTWSCDGQKKIFSNNDPVPVLFGKHLIDPLKTWGELIICEGQWDALTWQQLGYPAVSIPNGVSNDEWIGEDWNFLNCFSQIYLDFDGDTAGREAETRVRIRLGYERCRSIKYRFKDANKALMEGGEAELIAAFKLAKEAPIERILRPDTIMEEVRERLNPNSEEVGTPFFLPCVNFKFRPHEITVWYGSTSHGKSSVLSDQICYAASLGKKSFVASFEQDSPMTVAGMLTQYTADPEFGLSDHFVEGYKHLMERVLFFDSMLRANPKEICSTIVLAHKQLAVEEAVIDNVMTLEVDRQDNTAQANVADGFRVIAAQYPIHLHLVMHPRKPPSQEASKPPSIADIMGASEWSAMAHNIICVWRDVAKAQRMAEMLDAMMSEAEIRAFDESTPDGKIFWRKQRKNGKLPMVSYFYDSETRRAWKNPEDAAPRWHPATEDEMALTIELEDPLEQSSSVD